MTKQPREAHPIADIFPMPDDDEGDKTEFAALPARPLPQPAGRVVYEQLSLWDSP